MKALKITIDGRPLWDVHKETGWRQEDVKGFKFNLVNNPDGGAVFQCSLTGNEPVKAGGKVEIEIL